MRLTSAIALYVLFWTLSGFLVLPFGVRTHDEAGIARVPGQAESAPARFRPGRVIARTTVVATVLFGLFYLNYLYGWLPVRDLDVFGGGPPGYRDPDYLKPSPSGA